MSNQVSVAIENARLHADALSRMKEADLAKKDLEATLRSLSDSEEKLRLTLESVSEGITVSDLKGKILQVNDAALSMHGCDRREEVIGRSAFELIARKEHATAMHNLKRTLETGHSGLIEYTLLRKDGSEFPGELNASLIRDAAGEPIAFVACTRDITERKKAEERLRESERKYRLIADSTTDYISMVTFKGTYSYVSPSTRALGYEPEELLGKSGFDFIHPDDIKKLVPLWTKYATKKPNALLALKRENISEFINFRYRGKWGQWHYIEATANLVDALHGEGLDILLTCRDMTERKQAEDILRESEEKYRTIFESANDILVLLDTKGRIVDTNTKLSELGGYRREEVVGKNIRSLSKMMTKKSLAIVLKNFLKTSVGIGVPPFEVEMIKKNGELATAEISAVAIKKDGKIVGVLGILRDVTQRKQAEAELRAQKELTDRILTNAPNNVLVVGRDLQVVLANKTFYDTFKVKKGKVEGRRIDDIIPIADLSQAISNVLAGRESRLQIEFRHNIAATERTLVASIVPMQREETLLLLRDVTDEREKQERLYLTDRLASVGEMASGIAHELNNPLTGVIGLSQLLLENDMPDDIKEDIAAIYSEAQRAAGIVKKLLAFARKHAPVREATRINNVIEDVLKLRAYEDKVNNIEVNTNLDPQLPEIMVDSFQMQQVFLNIILNAETAMAETHNRGTLTITTRRIDNTINVSFTDDGPGIAKENLGRLFDPFFTTKEVGKGTGLGLSICYGIVTEHGGKIYAQSKLGRGATFVVELPVNTR